MKNGIKILSILLASVILIGGAYFTYSKLKDKVSLGQSSNPGISAIKADDFTVLDKNGKEVKLSSFYGKPIVLNFWASWCPPCREEMPEFQEAYESMGNDVTFIMVNLTDGSRETVETAKTFAKNNHYTFPVYFDTKQDAVSTYGIDSIPATFFINAKGEIINQNIGAISKIDLLNKIESIK